MTICANDLNITTARANDRNYGATAVTVGLEGSTKLCSLPFELIQSVLDYLIQGNRENPSDGDYLNIRSFAYTCWKCYNYVRDFFTETKVVRWNDLDVHDVKHDYFYKAKYSSSKGFIQNGEQAITKAGRLRDYGGELTAYGKKKVRESYERYGPVGGFLCLLGAAAVIPAIFHVFAIAIVLGIICAFAIVLFLAVVGRDNEAQFW